MGPLLLRADRAVKDFYERWKAWAGVLSTITLLLGLVGAGVGWLMRRAPIFAQWHWAEIALASLAAIVVIMMAASLGVFAYYLVRPKPQPSPTTPPLAAPPPQAVPASAPQRVPEVRVEKPREIHFLVRKHYLLDCLQRLKKHDEEFEKLTKSYLDRCKLWRRPPAEMTANRLAMSGGTRNPPDPEADYIARQITEMETDINAMFDDVRVKLSDAPAHVKNPARPLPEADGCDPAARALYSFASARMDHAKTELGGVVQKAERELRSVWETLSGFGRHSS